MQCWKLGRQHVFTRSTIGPIGTLEDSWKRQEISNTRKFPDLKKDICLHIEEVYEVPNKSTASYSKIIDCEG